MSPGIVPEEFALLRTPLMPMAEWWNWTATAADPKLDDAERQNSLAAKLTPAFLDGLYLSTPSLSDHRSQMVDEPSSKKGRGTAAAVATIYARAAARCTPLGAFAGTTLGAIGDTTSVRLAPAASYRKKFMLDLRWVMACCRWLEMQPEIRVQLRYSVNDTLWRLDRRYRFLEEFRKSELKDYHWFRVSTVEATDYLAHVIEKAEAGATLATLATDLAEFAGCTEPDTVPFIEKLVEAQVLVSELRPPLTGVDPGDWLVQKLQGLGQDDRAQALQDLLHDLNGDGFARLGTGPECYRMMESRLKAVVPDAEFAGKSIFFVNLWKPAERCSLGLNVVTEIQQALELLHRIAPPGEDRLRPFRRAFRERFETREIPLLEALDEETGIALSGLLDRVPGELAAVVPSNNHAGGREWSDRDAQLLGWVMELRDQGVTELRLDGRDLSRITADKPARLLPSFYVYATVAAQTAEQIDQGKFRVGLRGYMPIGALGRFAQEEPELAEKLRERAQQEAQQFRDQGAILAEICHYPAGQDLNNVLTRPQFLDYEIALGCGSTLSGEEVIHLRELTVRVDRGTVSLRCPRLDCEVIPRMHTAHRFDTRLNLSVYRFLGYVAQQYVREGPVWSWGILSDLPFLPRVTSGRVMLAPARWRVNRQELYPNTESEQERLQAVQAYRRRVGLPRFVILAQNDLRLPVDFDNVISVRGMIRQTQAWPHVDFEELFPAADELWVEGPEGMYSAEWMVPFRCTMQPSHRQLTHTPVYRERRAFPPGSEWLYAKLYLPAALQNEILIQDVRRLVADLEEKAWIDRWFFIRYQDPDTHLRVRFLAARGVAPSELGAMVKERLGDLVYRQVCWRIQYDTYEREMERYGGDQGIVWAEQVFHHDSQAVLELLRENPRVKPDRHWLLATAGLDSLLTDLGFDDTRKQELMAAKRDSFRAEFRSGKAEQQSAGDLFRKVRGDMLEIMGKARKGGFASLARRSSSIRKLVAERHIPDQLASDLCHMHCNRLLRSTQRMQELVIYDLMTRVYQSIKHGSCNHAA